MNSIEFSTTCETLGSFYLCVHSAFVRWIIGLNWTLDFAFCWPRYIYHQSQSPCRDLYCFDTVNLFCNFNRIPYELSRRYNYHTLHMVSYPSDQIQPDMSLAILDRQERVVRKKVIHFVKFFERTIHHVRRQSLCEPDTLIFLCSLVCFRLFRYLFLLSFSRTKILLRRR